MAHLPHAHRVLNQQSEAIGEILTPPPTTVINTTINTLRHTVHDYYGDKGLQNLFETPDSISFQCRPAEVNGMVNPPSVCYWGVIAHTNNIEQVPNDRQRELFVPDTSCYGRFQFSMSWANMLVTYAAAMGVTVDNLKFRQFFTRRHKQEVSQVILVCPDTFADARFPVLTPAAGITITADAITWDLRGDPTWGGLWQHIEFAFVAPTTNYLEIRQSDIDFECVDHQTVCRRGYHCASRTLASAFVDLWRVIFDRTSMRSAGLFDQPTFSLQRKYLNATMFFLEYMHGLDGQKREFAKAGKQECVIEYYSCGDVWQVLSGKSKVSKWNVTPLVDANAQQAIMQQINSV